METEQCRLANINNNFITTQSFYPLLIGLADRIEKKTSYTRQLIEKQEKIKEEIAWNTVEILEMKKEFQEKTGKKESTLFLST